MILFQCAPIDSPTFTGLVTISGLLAINGTKLDRSYVVSSPKNGDTITVAAATGVQIIVPAPSVAGLVIANTILFPPPQDGLRFECAFTGAIGKLTLLTSGAAGQSIQNAPTSAPAGSGFEYLFVAATNAWVRLR